MSVSFVDDGGFTYGTGTSLVAWFPTVVNAGNLAVLLVAVKSDANTVTTPSGWTRVAEGSGGGGSTGNDTGPTRIVAFTKECDGTEDNTNISVSVSGSNPGWTMITVWAKGSDPWQVAGANGVDTTTGSPFTATMGTDPGFKSGDMVLAAGSIPTDVSTPSQFSSETLTAPGATFTLDAEIGEADTSAGQDMGGVVCRFSCTAGPSTGAPTFSATAGGTTTNVRGPIIVVRIREEAAGGTPHTVNVNDSVTTSDARSFGRGIRLSDTLAVVDDPVAFDFEFEIQETVSLSDNVVTARGKGVLIADTLSLADNIAFARGIVLQLADTAGIADSFGRQADYQRTIAEASLALADNVARALAIARSLADSVSISDSPSLQNDYIRAINEAALTVSDVIALTNVYQRTIGDSAAISDQISASLGINRSIADSIGLADNVDAVLDTGGVNLTQDIADTLTLADSINLARAISLSQSDAVTLSDQISFEAAFTRGLGDSVSLSDAIVAAVGIQRSLADSLALSDAQIVSRVLPRTIADSISVADSILTEMGFNRSFSDAVSVSDLIDAGLVEAIPVLIADTVIVSDTIFPRKRTPGTRPRSRFVIGRF